MTPCPNCGTQVPPENVICPNCGVRVEHNAVWPPPPRTTVTGRGIDTRKLITGKRWADLWLGFAVAVIFSALVIGLVIIPILYFAFQEQYPTFRRGIGYGLLSMLAILLGAFALCTIEILHEH